MKSTERTDRGASWLSRVSIGILGLGVSTAFVWLTLRGVNLAQVRSHLQEIETAALFPALMSLALIFVYKAFRWQYQMVPLKHISFNWSFTAIVIGFMANNAVPIRGGDLLRAHVLAKRENIGTATVFATVALERIFDVVSLATLSLMLLLMFPLPLWIRNSVFILGTVLLGGTAGIMTFRRWSKLFENWWERGCRRLPDKLQDVLSHSIEQARLGLETARGKIRLTNLYILAGGEWILWGLLVKFSLQAIDIQLSMAAIMSMVIATNLAVILPAAPGYVGVFHYAVIVTLLFYQFDKNIALSGAVILHAISVIPFSIVGLMFFIRECLVPKGVLR